MFDVVLILYVMIILGYLWSLIVMITLFFKIIAIYNYLLTNRCCNDYLISLPVLY